MKFVKAGTLMLVLLAGLITAVLPVYAHGFVEVDPYTIILGWQNEPPVAGAENALVFRIVEGNDPVSGLENSLQAEVTHNGEVKQFSLQPGDMAGDYVTEPFMLSDGPYSARLFGRIGDVDVDVHMEAESVGEEAEPSSNNAANWLILGGLGLLVFGTAVFFITRRR
ncbi:MAG: hypothetical protein D6706_06610 [Chloroflexi bacterium]|nr:MAG: hypothetical protein D6706_06610 [Chloroflexota bacterium]